MKNNKLTCIDLDDLANTCLQIGIPHKMIPIFKIHRSLMYYPSPNLMTKYVDFYYRNKDYRGFFRFIQETKNCFWITKEDGYYHTAIKFAHEYNDKLTLVDILLYTIKKIKISDYYANVLLYANEHILKDRVYQKLFFKCDSNNNVNLQLLIDNNCIGLLFAELILNHYEKTNIQKDLNKEEKSDVDKSKANGKDYDKNITLITNKINDLIKDDTRENVGVEIFYNKEIKREMISMSGSEVFMKLDKKILSYMDSKMRVNIFEKLDLNENDVDKDPKDEPKIDVLKLKDELEKENIKLMEERIKKPKKSASQQQTPKTTKPPKEIKVSSQTLYIARRKSKKAAEKDKGGAGAGAGSKGKPAGKK